MPPLAEALIRHVPEDFRVEEIPAYAAAGEGEHLFVTFRKTDLTTLEAVRRIARALGADARAAGFAGMKDRHAITTQTASFQLPLDRDPAPELSKPIDGIEVLAWQRHRHKLKTGHLRGNRFSIGMRRVSLDARGSIDEALARIAARGVPNAFGVQRFGRDGDNAELALRWLRGEARPPRGKKEQRFLFSALQSQLFNRVLERREQDGTWCTVVVGDIAQKRDTGGLFDVEDPELEQARAERGEISATGPMFGARMRWPHAAVADLEREVLGEAGIGDALDAHRALGEGTRRTLRLWVEELTWQWSDEEPYLAVQFVLPKGGYATTVLSRAFRLVDPYANP
jgi:tRNA pseudouridine13 synthase